MYQEGYDVFSDSRHEMYEFLSSGPKGAIRKIVVFEEKQPKLYNLAFGDWNEEIQDFRDDVRSNNGDRNKVLATVAYIVVDFMMHHPEARLYAEGVTKARTRLYQMGINVNWNEISQFFEIEGRINGRWEPFKRNKNYDAFTLEVK
jgi:hypothetical protein